MAVLRTFLPPVPSLDSPLPAQDEPPPAIRPWRVLHACEGADPACSIADLQRSAGMRPLLLTQDGPIPIERLSAAEQSDHRTSLLNAWNDVRHWRRILLETDPGFDSDIVHAHSFPSGMAGVRNCPVVVYQLSAFIEELGIHHGSSSIDSGNWLSRSFRVAEQFVLTRAAAVVVPYSSLKQAAVQRGAQAENVFVIPPIYTMGAATARFQTANDLHRRPADVLISAPEVHPELRDGKIDKRAHNLLLSFEIIASECDEAELLICAEEPVFPELRKVISGLGLEARVRLLPIAEAAAVSASADVVVASPPDGAEHESSASLSALLNGQALLAADTAVNRDITPDGRGCLWFHQDDVTDLAHRVAFLVRNPDFRRALAASGRRFVDELGDPQKLAARYDRVYRHASARRRSGGLQTPAARLEPLTAN